MGRIYRVYPMGSPDDVNPKLVPADLDSLTAALGDSNLFWRLAAQRLIVESKSATAAAKLKEIVKSSPSGRAATHAFYALQGLGAVDAETTKIALSSANRGLRRAAISHGVSPETGPGTITAADSRELAETFIALTRLAPSEEIGKSLHATLVASKDSLLADPTLAAAWQAAARHHAAGVILASLSNPSNTSSAAPVNLIPNGDFSDSKLGGWSLRSYMVERPGTIDIRIAPGGKEGGNALKIISPFVADAGAGMSLVVKPNTRYRLGGMIRTEKFENRGGKGAMINVHGIGSSEGVSGTRDWTPVSFEFSTVGGQNEILVHCLVGGYGGGTGTAWFDDLFLHEISSGNAGDMVAAVVQHFVTSRPAAAKAALATALASRTDETSKNLVASLRSGPVLTAELVRKNAPDPAVHARGLAVYSRTCIACHGPDGKGVPGAFPPLDGASWVTGDPSVSTRIILGGLLGPIEVSGQKYENVMPPHTDLNDQEIADVITYIRQSWSNDATPVSADSVKQTRAKYATRTTPWTAAELK